MRILVISNLYPPDFIGGYELFCKQAVDGLRKCGHEVRVCTTSPQWVTAWDDNQGIERRLTLAYPWEPHYQHDTHSSVLTFQSKISCFHNTWQVMESLRQFRPDVVYLHGLLGLGALAILDLFAHLGVPWVWHLEDSFPSRIFEVERAELLSLSLVGSSKDFSFGTHIACSRRLVEEIANKGCRLGESVYIIPNWVCPSEGLSERSFWKAGLLKAVNAGQIMQHKGIDRIIEAAGLLLREGFRDFSVDLYGHGEIERFSGMAEMAGVASFVNFQGPLSQEELRIRLRDYDVFLFPTWAREPFGLAPVEAAAEGVLPIITAGTGCSEWLLDRQHSLHIAESSTSLARSMIDILTGKVDLEALARNAMSFVRSDLHPDRIVPMVEEILQRACAPVPWESIDWERAHRLFLLVDKTGLDLAIRPIEPEQLSYLALLRPFLKKCYQSAIRKTALRRLASESARWFRLRF
jgi:glycosyltransferase involved in cell wall biosynthesis